jgi:carbon-monoxide dehydrogenase medium subunit
VKPAPFTYHRPESSDDVFDIFDSVEDIDDVKVIAGGQSLIPLMALRLAQPAHLIDINGLAGDLGSIEPAPGTLRIGALARQRVVEHSPAVAQQCPLLAEALTHVAHPAIRNRGTIGGSLAHADPAAELPAVVLALDAELTVRGRDGTRRIPARNFFQGLMTTALEPDEILQWIDIPALPAGSGTAFVEVSRRQGDFAMVGAAAAVTVEGERIVDARLALAGVAGTAVRATAVEEALRGEHAEPRALREAAALAAAGLDPPADPHASSSYRRHVAAVTAARALVIACDRATGGTADGAH